MKETKKTFEWTLILIFGAVIVFTIVAISLIYKYSNPVKDTIEFEIVKLLFQVITVLVLGQVITFVIGEFNYSRKQADDFFNYKRQKADEAFNLNRQKAEVKIEVQKDILSRVVKNYTAIKKHRRLLRAKALFPAYIGEIQDTTIVKFDAYDEQMELINGVELEFENISEEIKSNSDSFNNSKVLINNVEKMIDYLRDLIKLYEQKQGSFNKATQELLLSKLEIADKGKKINLKDFIGNAKGSKLESEFFEPYNQILEVIRKNIKETIDSVIKSIGENSFLTE